MAALSLLIAIGGGSSARAASTGLVAAYSFDQGSGTSAPDASGNGNIGTLAGASWTATGKHGGALRFNGSSNYVSIKDAASLKLTAGMTLEAWINPTALSGSWRTVIFKERAGGMAYSLYANNDSNFPVGQVYMTAEQNSPGASQLPLNTWSFATATFDGSNLRLYLNGSLKATKAISGPLPATSGALKIGGNSIWGEWFKGQIDDVRVYNRPLAAAEIQSDMSTSVSDRGAPPADTQAPSLPAGIAETASTQTSATLSWSASSDNVGVAGYGVYVSGVQVATRATPGYTLSGLACGSSTAVRIDAYDAAGNRSAQSSFNAATVSCSAPSDTQAPSVPTGVIKVMSTATSISISWTASTDNVGVSGYGLYRNGVSASTTSTTAYTYSGLTCGTSYTLGVNASDAAGNHSAQASLVLSTNACSDTTPPSAPAGLAAAGAAQTSISVSWSASSDNVGVVGYGVYINGVGVGSSVPTSYTFSGLSCGTAYTLAVDAFDAAGNRSGVVSFVGSTSVCSVGVSANLWVDTGGGSCVRSAVPAGYVSAQACGSLDAAYAAASAGDLVRVRAGVYSSSGLNTGRINFVVGRSGPDVVFTNDQGATPVIDSLDIAASYVTVRGSFVFHALSVNGQGTNPVTSVTVDGVVHNGIVVDGLQTPGPAAWISDASNVTFKHIDLCCSYNNWMFGIWASVPAGTHTSNITVDDMDIHENREPNGSPNHLECMYISGATNVTITNSRFWHCTTFDLFVTTNGDNYPVTGLVLTNNQFGETYASASDGGCCDSFSVKWLTGAPESFPLDGVVIRHNTFETTLHLGLGAVSGAGFTMFGNLLLGGSGSNNGPCPVGGSYGYNVTTTPCAAGDTSATEATMRAGLVADYATAVGNPPDDYHLKATSVARGKGEPTSPGPTSDKDGVNRTTPSDAGMYQYH